MNISKVLITGTMLLSAVAFAGDYDRGNHNGKGSPAERTYAVTITNVTAGQVFTPVLVATHTSEVGFFELVLHHQMSWQIWQRVARPVGYRVYWTAFRNL